MEGRIQTGTLSRVASHGLLADSSFRIEDLGVVVEVQWPFADPDVALS